MFLGVAVDDSTSFVPGQRFPSEHNTTDEEEEAREDDDQLTPLSIGSKRANNTRSTRSTRSTGSSPNKKSRRPVVRAMDNNMKDC
jgi:hypothetical protein